MILYICLFGDSEWHLCVVRGTSISWASFVLNARPPLFSRGRANGATYIDEETESRARPAPRMRSVLKHHKQCRRKREGKQWQIEKRGQKLDGASLLSACFRAHEQLSSFSVNCEISPCVVGLSRSYSSGFHLTNGAYRKLN